MSETQLLASAAPSAAADAHYSLLVARDLDEVRAAQRLRYRVFAEEMGAAVQGGELGLDQDAFDEYCDHLIVRDDQSGEVVGTYRMLPPSHAGSAGMLYSETEFDLSALDPLRPRLVETGRSCVHPEHRNGAVVSLVWAGIARYMLLHGHTMLAGCASVPLADGGVQAAHVWRTVSAKHYAPEELRVHPRQPWRADGIDGKATIPPLLRGYLRLGAQVCGPPAHDADFGVADFFVLVDLDKADKRYLRYFLGESQ